MLWNDVKDKLPLQDGEPSYDWVIVSTGNSDFAIARYGHRNVDALIPGWEFWDNNEDTTNCPYAGDAFNGIHIDDIKYWMEVPKTPNQVQHQLELDRLNKSLKNV